MSIIDMMDAATWPTADAVLPPAEQVTDAAGRLVAALMEAQRTRSRAAWLTVTTQSQHLVNSATAVQDAAIVQVARRESICCEDGTLGETVHAPGRVAIDAADLVAPSIAASHAQAQRRVEQAVRLAAGRVPAEVDDRHPPAGSGLHALHRAMLEGRLDSYRAGLVAHELEAAPAEVADAVVAAVSGHLTDDAPTLRRRVRRVLARISPDLLRQRAERARASTGLRRWVAEPGVDEWHGTFPSEDAASAWAAIDRLAHDLVADGTCSSVEQARGRALTDLVTGNATVEVQVVLTVPADAATTTASPVDEISTATNTAPAPALRIGGDDGDLVEVQGARPSEPLLVRRGWLRDHLPTSPPRTRRGREPAAPRFVPCDPLTGARVDPHDHLVTDAYRPRSAIASMVRARDGRCRFPGCTVAARFCDLDHVRPWPIGRTAARNLLTLCRRHHRIKQRPGWRVHLASDATATWTDPAGRVRTTAALDALHTLVLTAATPTPANPASAGDGSAPPSVSASGDGTASCDRSSPTSALSVLETHTELLLQHRAPHRRCTSAAQLRPASARARVGPPGHAPPPF